MAEADHSQNISEFCNLTGTDPDRARFYLEAANWDTNLAMSNYYEEADEDHNEDINTVYPPAESPKPKPKVIPASGPRIATFANLTNDTEEEEEGQAFYAGGSVRSGQQVLGPGKRKSGNQIVEDLFDAVKKNCGELLNQSDRKPSSSKPRAFHGAGHVLGFTTEGTNPVPGDNNGDSAQPPREIRLSLWKTGFTVDDGPIRDYEEPHNKEFLDSIRQGEIPPELRRQSNGRETHISLDDKSHEDYVPPKKMVQVFSGTGFRLGNISPRVTSASTADCRENEEKAQSSIGVDDSRPTTSIQIRLADGTRLVMTANHNHTVGDIRRFIVLSRPEYGGSEFSLMTSFPTKELSDDGASLEESSLLNSVIVQKLK